MSTLSSMEPETRNEFYVSGERKQIWACLLDLLSVVDGICKKYNITYYADSGTLLGAVRHGGFIPWDDDLDIAMMRSDYNRFLEVAPKEISGKYFLQTTLTDVNYYKEHARIRNSETTGICEHYELHGCNNGIYLDILPLENYSDSLGGRFRSLVSRTIGRILYVKVHYKTRPSNTMKSHIIYCLGFLLNLKKTHIFREKLETRNARKSTKYVVLGDMYFAEFPPSRLIFDRDDYKEVIYLPFENGTIPAPSGYHDILTKGYGDYMELPPVETRGLHHSIIFDPNMPYKEYIDKNRAELEQRKYRE